MNVFISLLLLLLLLLSYIIIIIIIIIIIVVIVFVVAMVSAFIIKQSCKGDYSEVINFCNFNMFLGTLCCSC